MTRRNPSTRTLTLTTRSLGRGIAATALALALAGCGGTADPVGADQPRADDVGAEPTADQGLQEQEPPATSSMCVEEQPDCQDTIEPSSSDSGTSNDSNDSGGSGDAAAGSCLEGDADCTDESYGGKDMARPIPLTDSPSDAARIERGATSGSAGRTITAARLVHDTLLELTFEGGACDLVEDVVVEESPDEVRVLVLSGMGASVEVCTMQMVPWSIEVQLDEPLGDRTLLDLAG